jgi:excisionase family DNA binding protein
MNMDQILLTIADACRALGVGRSKLYELIAAGELSVRKCGRKSLILRTEVVALADRLPVVPRRPAGVA